MFSLVFSALAAPTAPTPSLAAMRVTAQVQRGSSVFWAVPGTALNDRDSITFRVTVERGGFLSLLDYAPSGFVTTHCAPGDDCLSIPVEAGIEIVVGPFPIEGDVGWEMFDLVLTKTAVKPKTLQRFALPEEASLTSASGTKSIGDSRSSGQHRKMDTLLKNQPELVVEWMTFSLRHERGGT